MKKWGQFLNEDLSNIDELFQHIESFPKKIKISKPYQFYDTGLETAISNSEITSFYTKYQRSNFKKYVKSIPFPFEKLTPDNIKRFEKLNLLCHIFDKYSENILQLGKWKCIHLMDVILYDMYFDVKSRRHDIYEKLDEIIIPNAENDLDCKKFGIWFTDKENPLNYIVFLSNTNDIVNRIRNY